MQSYVDPDFVYDVAIVCVGKHVTSGALWYRWLVLVSALCLLVTLGVCVRELRTLHDRCLVCHVAALLVAYSCNLAGQTAAFYASEAACQVTGQSAVTGQVRS